MIGGRLSMGHARALLSLEGKTRLLDARNQIVKKQLSVRQAEALVKKLKAGPKSIPEHPAAVSPELVELTERLQRKLGTRVKIQVQGRGARGGKIEIAFHSAEELERLLEWFETR